MGGSDWAHDLVMVKSVRVRDTRAGLFDILVHFVGLFCLIEQAVVLFVVHETAAFVF